MKPLHATVTRISRCPCCQSKHSRKGANKTNTGKSAARQQVKRDIRRDYE